MATPNTIPPKKRNTKGAPPTDESTAIVGNNLHKPESGSLAPMNFKVDPEFQREFKTFAVMNGMKMVDLLKASFDFYKAHKGH